MAKTQSNKIKSVSTKTPTPSWKSLSAYKKIIPILFDNETIFTIEELSAEQFETYMQKIQPEKQKSVDDINSIIGQEENLADILKLMVKGVSFEGQSNAEILNSMNTFSTSVVNQINDALQELLINNMVKHLHNISNTIDTFEAVGKVDEKVQKLTAMNKANENIV